MSDWLTISDTGGTGNTTITVTAASSSELYTRIKLISAETTIQHKTAEATIRQRGSANIVEPPEYITTYYYVEDTGTTLRPTEVQVCNLNVQPPYTQTPDRNKPYLTQFRVDGGDWHSARNDMQHVGGSYIGNGKYIFTSVGWHMIEWQVGRYDGFSYITDNTIVPAGSFAITEVEIVLFPDSIQEIGASCCRGGVHDVDPDHISKLTYVYYPSGLTSVGSNAFAKTKVTDVIMKSGVTYGEGVYRECGNLTALTIENGVTDIPSYSFGNCANLNLGNIVIPDSIEHIGSRAFQYTINSLSPVPYALTLPINLTAIDDGAFIRQNITALTINDALQVVKRDAFSDCALTQININPHTSQLKAIGSRGFGNQTPTGTNNLREFTFPAGYTNNYNGYAGYINESFCYNQNLSAIYSYMPDVSNINNGSAKFPHGAAQTGVFHYPAGADYSSWTNGDWPTNPNWTFVADL